MENRRDASMKSGNVVYVNFGGGRTSREQASDPDHLFSMPEKIAALTAASILLVAAGVVTDKIFDQQGATTQRIIDCENELGEQGLTLPDDPSQLVAIVNNGCAEHLIVQPGQ